MQRAYVVNSILLILIVLALVRRHFLRPSRCADTPEAVGQLGEDFKLHCVDAVWMCHAEGRAGEHIRSVCPSTCGLCKFPFEAVCSDSPNAVGTQSGEDIFCKDLDAQCAGVDASISEQCPRSCGMCESKSGSKGTKLAPEKLKKKDHSVAAGKGRTKAPSLEQTQSAVEQVKCAVCKYLVQAVVDENSTVNDEFEAVVTNVCDRRTAFSRWMLFFDIRLEGHHLEIHKMEQQGVCGRDCATLQQACLDVMRNGRNALEDMVASKAKLPTIVQQVCAEHCQSRDIFSPDDTWVDEPFKPEDRHVVEAELQDYRMHFDKLKNAARGRGQDDFDEL